MRSCRKLHVITSAPFLPSKRLPSNATQDTPPEPADPRTPDERRRSMTWAQRLKRVFNIDVSTCVNCGGAARIVASVEEPKAIRAILDHFEKHGALAHAHYRPRPRGPPAAAT